MANVITGMIPELYEALFQHSRELQGFIPAVARNSNGESAAVGQTIRVPKGVAGAKASISPGQLPPNTGDSTVDYVDMTIQKAEAVPIRWNGEEQKAIGHAGQSYNAVLANQFFDAFRKLSNQIELDCANAVKAGASRAYGTAGTAPFGTASDLTDIANIRKILEDNGAPMGNLELVLNSSAMVNLRGKQSVLFKVNEAGSSDMLRNGMTDRLQGFALRQSGQIGLHTKGTGSAYELNDASSALGDVVIAADTGTGTILAGDIVTLVGDTNKYVVNSALSGGSFTIGNPGLRVDGIAENAVITVGNSYTGNYAFDKNAVQLITRAPALVSMGGKAADSAIDRMMVTDPFSGLMFEVSVYSEYRQVHLEIGLAWGVNVIQSEHIATLLG